MENTSPTSMRDVAPPPFAGQEFQIESPFGPTIVRMLRNQFGLREPIEPVIAHLLAQPGKELRPKLAYAVANCYAATCSETIVCGIAAAGECLHTASLIHDDIVDDATKRRGVAAVHQVFDTVTAVLGGDYLMGAALSLLSDSDGSHARSLLGPTVRILAESQMLEIQVRGEFDDMQRSRAISEGKTGALFGWIAAAVAAESGAHRHVEPWLTWGNAVGLLFQLADDLGDELGSDGTKDAGLDSQNETPSWLSSMRQADPTLGLLVREHDSLTAIVRNRPADSAALDQWCAAIIDVAQARLDAFVGQQQEVLS